VHFAELTAPEQRVLGCLIEKRWTTPDQYPLSLNALRLACNQSTNRDPITNYDEATVRAAAQRLSLYGLTRLASGHSSRAIKYRHLAEEALGLDREQLAILCVLLLRGPQTPGELKSRSDRMASLPSLADVERVLDELGERGYARRVPRRPGQKEDRFEQLLGGDGDGPDGDGAVGDLTTEAVIGGDASAARSAAPVPGGEPGYAGTAQNASAVAARSAASSLTPGASSPADASLPTGASSPAGASPTAGAFSAAGASSPAGAAPSAAAAPGAGASPVQPRPPDVVSPTALEMRVTALEAEVRRLRAALDALRTN
jgi:uncharacterized protein